MDKRWMSDSAETHTRVAESARQFAPVVWLLGKVQSGKTSIIRTLTQTSTAEIGSGFAPCTRTSRVFDFPAEAPIIRFLDTRGLGEVAYDPAEDIAFCERRTHLLLAVVKALDIEQEAVLDVVRAARRRHPDWPVIVAQTSLHEGYGASVNHILPYPFSAPFSMALPHGLVRALVRQRSLFQTLPGSGAPTFVPIDFTLPDDGFEPVDYGREALVEALMTAAPAALAVAIAELADNPADKLNAHILGFALAAGASDALPIAGVVAVPAVQAAMLQQLAKLCGTSWDKRAYAEFAAALGAGTLIRTGSSFGIRQLVKLIPVYGQTAGAAAAAAASFATTYAMGRAAAYFLLRRRQGEHVDEVVSVYRVALRQAFGLAKARNLAADANGASR